MGIAVGGACRVVQPARERKSGGYGSEEVEVEAMSGEEAHVSSIRARDQGPRSARRDLQPRPPTSYIIWSHTTRTVADPSQIPPHLEYIHVFPLSSSHGEIVSTRSSGLQGQITPMKCNARAPTDNPIVAVRPATCRRGKGEIDGT